MGEAIKIRKRTYWTTETFKERMKEINANINIKGNYINNNTPIECECLICKYPWSPIPKELLNGTGCPKCAGTLKKSHEEFLNEFYEKNGHANDIEILTRYVNNKVPLDCKCKICGHPWSPLPTTLLRGSGCRICGRKIASNKTRKSKEVLLKESEEINKNIEIVSDNYENCRSVMICKCKICGYEFPRSAEYLLSGIECPVCVNRVALKGYNDIATTRPDLIPYFDNIEDSYTVTTNNTKEINMHCIFCGYKKLFSPCKLSSRGFPCPVCGDGVSYPNKFSRGFLFQLPVNNLIFEYSPKWANGKRYDNYFEYNGKAYILEMDGEFHYKYNYLNHKTVEESQKIDKEKDDLATKHNIEVIRIDCRQSDMTYISKNILSSKLSSIFDLSNIDWIKCNEYGTKNLVKSICDDYNICKNVDKLCKIYNRNRKVIQIYLRKGHKNGWCPTYMNDSKIYISKTIGEKKSKQINVFKNNELIHSFKSMTNCADQMTNIYNLYFCISKISNCCNGKISQYKGFQFKFA